MKNLILILLIMILCSLPIHGTTYVMDTYVNTTTLYGNIDMGYIQNGELNCSSNTSYMTGISMTGKSLVCINESWVEESKIGSLNVNSSNQSVYWGSYHFITDLNYGILSSWTNITNSPTHLSNFTDDINYSAKNTNSSNNWDNYNTVNDLDYLIVSSWNNITSKPTHLSNFTDDLNHSSFNVNSSANSDNLTCLGCVANDEISDVNMSKIKNGNIDCPGADYYMNGINATNQSITCVQESYINSAGDTTGALTSDLNIDANTLVVSYDDNKVGIGTDTPDTKLHVMLGDAGSNTGNDAITVAKFENPGNSWIGIGTNSTGIDGIFFSDVADSNPGAIYYDNSVDTMYLRAKDANRVIINDSVAQFFNNINIDALADVDRNIYILSGANKDQSWLTWARTANEGIGARAGYQQATNTFYLQVSNTTAGGFNTIFSVAGETNTPELDIYKDTDLQTHLLTNIGNNGTDFDANGGLVLAGNLTTNNINTQAGNITTNTTCISIIGLTSTLNIW